jgi:hypothetical protein
VLKKAIFLTCGFLAAYASGQTPVVVHLPVSGDYAVFATHGAPLTPPISPTLSKGGDVTVPADAGSNEISVWNRATGNMASVPIKQVASGWVVSDSMLTHVALVDILVQQNGAPIQAAEVQLSDSAQRDPQIVDPSSAGVAKFFNVAPGRLTVTVRAKDTAPVIQLFQLALARSDVEPKFTMSVAAAAGTAASGSFASGGAGSGGAVAAGSGTAVGGVGTAAPGGHASHDNAPGTGGVVVTYLLALVVAAGVGFAIFTYFKKYPGTVSEKLEQLGVQIPKPDNIGAAGGAPVAFDPQPKPAPVQKIILDDAAPTPLSSPSTTPYLSPMGTTTVLQEPSLLSSSGVAIPLAEGETVVGRDAGLGLSLTGESSISRRHASLVKQGSSVTVNDLGSTNGTFVNGVKLASPTTLKPGDSVQFGAVSFRYQA